MNIEEMSLDEIEVRLTEIDSIVENADSIIDGIEDEKRSLIARKAELVAIEERARQAEALTSGEAMPEKKIELKVEERKMYTPETNEYRSAFYANLRGEATPEQRALFVDNTQPGNGDALLIPKALDEKIWDNIHTAHPILNDISVVRSGMAIEVTKHTAIAARTTKKLDKTANAGEEENTFVKVVLYGYDYEKYVEMSYAEARMSDGALEDYLAQEISAELGEALAKDVFAQIETDAGAGQKVTGTSDMFADVKAALALATIGGAKTIYAPATSYYEIVGAIKSGAPFNIGATMGCEVKLDNAAAHVTVLDPKAFLLNEVQPITIESDKDVKNHHVVVSGYLRAQGTLRQSKAAAYID